MAIHVRSLHHFSPILVLLADSADRPARRHQSLIVSISTLYVKIYKGSTIITSIDIHVFKWLKTECLHVC